MLRKRQALKPEERIVRDVAAASDRTMNRAIKLLAAKPRSIRELRTRLLEKSWTNEVIVDAVLEKLRGYKYLDDEQFAKDFALARLRQKPQGKIRLRQTLAQKDLDKDVVESAIGAAFEKLPEEVLLDQALEKRIRLRGLPKTRDDTKKLYDHLLRQGFAYDLIREKIRSVRATPEDVES